MLSSLRIDLKRLGELGRIADRGRLHELAHHITGGAHMIGADRVVSACRELERACRDGSAEVLRFAVDSLREAMQDLVQQLQA